MVEHPVCARENPVRFRALALVSVDEIADAAEDDRLLAEAKQSDCPRFAQKSVACRDVEFRPIEIQLGVAVAKVVVPEHRDMVVPCHPVPASAPTLEPSLMVSFPSPLGVPPQVPIDRVWRTGWGEGVTCGVKRNARALL